MTSPETTGTVPLWRSEYEAQVEAGLLDDQRVELVAGRKVPMSPESALHATVVDAVADQLEAARGAGLRVRVGHPLALSDIDEPEPDVAVVVDQPEAYRLRHPFPDETRLVVEVANRSLTTDLGEKAERYAAVGIADYWVVDLSGRRVVVHRRPDASAAAFRSVADVAFGSPVAPLALPSVEVTVR